MTATATVTPAASPSASVSPTGTPEASPTAATPPPGGATSTPAPAATPRATSTPNATATPAATATAAPPQVGSWTSTAAPAGAVSTSSEWIAVAAPGGKTILANVIRPGGAGARPVIVLLHGQSGFSNAYLSLGAELSRAGYVVVAGCWFGGHYDGSSTADPPPSITLAGGIACPNGPTLKSITSAAATEDVAALVTAARSLSGVESGGVALVGNSRGSIIAILTEALRGGGIGAVAGIGGAPPGGALLAAAIASPVLLLQGEEDSVVPVVNAQSLEAGLTALGRTVVAHYYPQHGHGILFDTPQHSDAVARVTEFLDTYLPD
ncbi:MAG: hypothetical protein AMXMBFR23_25280 [Chloroflexota bacterium]